MSALRHMLTQFNRAELMALVPLMFGRSKAEVARKLRRYDRVGQKMRVARHLRFLMGPRATAEEAIGFVRGLTAAIVWSGEDGTLPTIEVSRRRAGEPS